MTVCVCAWSDFLLSVALLFALLLSLFCCCFFRFVGPKSFYGIFMGKFCASPPPPLPPQRNKYHSTSNCKVLNTRTHTHTYKNGEYVCLYGCGKDTLATFAFSAPASTSVCRHLRISAHPHAAIAATASTVCCQHWLMLQLIFRALLSLLLHLLSPLCMWLLLFLLSSVELFLRFFRICTYTHTNMHSHTLTHMCVGVPMC